jgi:hypothetical protein
MLAVAGRDRSRSASAGPEFSHKLRAGHSILTISREGKNEQAWMEHHDAGPVVDLSARD